MLVRYPVSIGAGAIVATALIFWMLHGISDGGFASPTRATKPLLTAVRLTYSQPLVGLDGRRLQFPLWGVPVAELPDAMTALPNPTIVRLGTAGPVTPPGPPDPLGRPDDRRGPWIRDTDLLLVARVAPVYPFSQSYRGI